MIPVQHGGLEHPVCLPQGAADIARDTPAQPGGLRRTTRDALPGPATIAAVCCSGRRHPISAAWRQGHTTQSRTNAGCSLSG